MYRNLWLFTGVQQPSSVAAQVSREEEQKMVYLRYLANLQKRR
jgi:hypothetical protein